LKRESGSSGYLARKKIPTKTDLKISQISGFKRLVNVAVLFSICDIHIQYFGLKQCCGAASFYPALGKNFDAAPAPAPTLLYSKAKFLK
jgi:hypothetical protein